MCNYITQKDFDELDAEYEKICSGLVNMMNNVNQWCSTYDKVKEAGVEYMDESF